MIAWPRQRLLVFLLALFLGVGAGLSSAQAGQIANLRAADTDVNLPADCLFCADDGKIMDAAACMILCANSSAAVMPIIGMAVDLPAVLTGGSPEIPASRRVGRPDPYPPKV